MNQKDHKFEAKADEGFFLGYSNESKAFLVFNINSQITKESIQVIFDGDSYTNDPIDHPAFVLDEFTHYPSIDFELTEPVIPFDQDFVPSSSDPSEDSIQIKDYATEELSESPSVESPKVPLSNSKEHPSDSSGTGFSMTNLHNVPHHPVDQIIGNISYGVRT